jgi:hypothetical protein
MAETFGIVSFDEWIEQNNHKSLPVGILDKIRNDTWIKFCASPTILDEDVAVLAAHVFIGTYDQLIGALETGSFAYIYQVNARDGNLYDVRGNQR